MRTNFLLIDLENVQPDKLQLVDGGKFKVDVFVGNSVPTDSRHCLSRAVSSRREEFAEGTSR